MPDVLVWLIKSGAIFGILLGTAAYMTLAERKVSAWIQYRYGPNRVGPWGLFQPFADLIKFIFKEEMAPTGANPLMFRLAPLLTAVPAMLTVAVIPFGPEIRIGDVRTNFSVADLDVGALYLVAFAGLTIYGIILGGWSSNSKYSLLGGLRASAQMVSYELTLILCLLTIVAMSGSLDLREIVNVQGERGVWNVFMQPVAFLLFVVATFAETNRHPFDFAECEPELVGGFHTEYSAMRFALFFLGEYCAMIVMAGLTVTLFLGGFHIPFVDEPHWILGFLAFMAKTALFLFLFIWVRWTLPRFRFDQLMSLGWKVFLPIALLNLFLTGAAISLLG